MANNAIGTAIKHFNRAAKVVDTADRALGKVNKFVNTFTSPLDAKIEKKEKEIKSKSEVLKFPTEIGQNEGETFLQIRIYKEKRAKLLETTDSKVQPKGEGSEQTAEKKKQTPLQNAQNGSKPDVGTPGAKKKSDKQAKNSASVGSQLKRLRSNARKDAKFNSTQDEQIATIVLPMPNNLKYADSHGWGETGDMKLAGGLLQSDFTTIKGATSAASDLGKGLALTGITAISEMVGLKGIVPMSTGKIQNPLVGMIYEKTERREFGISYKFMIRSREEADVIQRVIQVIRLNAAAKESGSGGNKLSMLEFPNTFQFEFSYVDGGVVKMNPFLFRIRRSYIKSVNTNVTSAGVFASLERGVPTEVSFELAFTERQKITRDDIDGEGGF